MRKKLLGLLLILAVFTLGFIVLSRTAPAGSQWLEAYQSPEYAVIRVVEDGARPTPEEQMETLAELGFAPAPDQREAFAYYLSAEVGWPQETLEQYPYWLCFTGLGACYVPGDEYELGLEYPEDYARVADAVYFSDDIFHFPHHSFDEPEQYVYVLSQVGRISGGAIQLEDMDGGRDLLGRTWVSFTLNGETRRYLIRKEYNHWFNANLLTEVSELAGEGPDGRCLYWRDDSLGFDMVYRSRKELETLAERTGINFFGLSQGQIILP